MSQFNLHSQALAIEVARRLAPLQAGAVALDRARLNSRMHHSGLLAVVVTVGSVQHIVAVVDGSKVIVDGPGAGTPAHREIKSETDLAQMAERLRQIAEAWLTQDPLAYGVFELAANLTNTLASVGLVISAQGSPTGAKAFLGVFRYGGQVGEMELSATDTGIRMSCGPHQRFVRYPQDLMGFEQVEQAELLRQVAVYDAFFAEVRRARSSALRLVDALTQRFPAQKWHTTALDGPSESSRLAAYVSWIKEGAGSVGVAEILIDGPGLVVSFYDQTPPVALATPEAFEAKLDELVVAAQASTLGLRASMLVEGQRYSVLRAFDKAEPGQVLTFRQTSVMHPSDELVWFFDGPGGQRVSFGENDPESRSVSLYLEVESIDPRGYR